jgi:hypothetical protein
VVDHEGIDQIAHVVGPVPCLPRDPSVGRKQLDRDASRIHRYRDQVRQVVVGIRGPLVGGLMEQGMNPGAGMAFLLAGGVTSIPSAIAVFALARLPVFAAYIGFSLVGVMGPGLLYAAIA